MIRIHNTEIDEIVDREMSDQEFEQYLADKKNFEDGLQEQNNKETARASALAKLAALGLTEDEIAAL